MGLTIRRAWVIAAAGLLWGCACQQQSGDVVAPRSADAPPERGLEMAHLRPVVALAPPEVRNETKTPQPTEAHVWVPGYWGWSGVDFVWRKGDWSVPPSPNMVWVKPEWESVEAGYRFKPGDWKWEKPK